MQKFSSKIFSHISGKMCLYQSIGAFYTPSTVCGNQTLRADADLYISDVKVLCWG